MNKIYYIIIFILIITLGMLYTQLIDYKEITTSLLDNNKQSIIKIKKLENHTLTLETQNKEFETKLIALEENLRLKETTLEQDSFSSTDNDNLALDFQKEELEKQDTPNSSVSPNVTLDDENKVTGFGLKYSQKF